MPFLEAHIDGKALVLLEIERAYRQPVQFGGMECIRVGSNKKKLKEFPEKERALWRLFNKALFENGIALGNPDCLLGSAPASGHHLC